MKLAFNEICKVDEFDADGLAEVNNYINIAGRSEVISNDRSE